MENHRLALTPGYQIEHFRIESVLGKGGFGITYVAVNLQLGKQVAIKELLPDSIATRIDGSTVVPHSESQRESWEWARERFLDEARVLAGFSHPAIVGVHRLIEANGTIYMVMDYVDGESYEARLRRIGREPDQAALMAVIGPILDGLSEVHAKNLLHRDIKPENILIDRRGQPVLIDFGSARMAVGATMTMTSIVTHGYSPAEQYQTKGKMGPWTDIYALGAVMCRAITGEKPTVASDRLMEDDFLWLSNRGLTKFDETFLGAADWALRVRPEERPPRIEDWETQLVSKSRFTPFGEIATVEKFNSSSIDHVSDTLVRRTDLAQKFKARPLVTAAIIGIALSGAIFTTAYVIQSKESERRAIAAKVEAEQKRTEQQRIASAAANAAAAKAAAVKAAAVKAAAVKAAADRAAADKAAADKAAADKAAADKAAAVKAAADRAAADRAAAYKAAADKAAAAKIVSDPARALEMHRDSEKKRLGNEQFSHGVAHALGEGRDKNPTEAVECFRKAAELGHAAAQFNLGVMYDNGEGVAKNPVKAVEWYRKAAEQGHAMAQFRLGLMLVNGLGVGKNRAIAEGWIRRAAQQGDGSAKDWLNEQRKQDWLRKTGY